MSAKPRLRARPKSILDARPAEAVEDYLDVVERVIGADRGLIRDVALKTTKFFQGDPDQQTDLGKEIEARWYESLKGKPDWDVYATDYYVGELWACWVVYSRTYLRMLRKSDRVLGASFVEHVGPVQCVLDLGCGTGLTSAALKELFPDARVVGTNLEGTRQIEVARHLSERHGFEVSTTPDVDADLVFASEYFEHVPSPIRHLQDVLAASNPRALLVANAFGTTSVGHFPCYNVGGKWVNGTQTKAAFAREMRGRGYEKVKTGFWNNRPTYWRRRP